MIIVTTRWKKPVPGSYSILFPDNDALDLIHLKRWVKDHVGQEYGVTIPEMKFRREDVVDSDQIRIDPWLAISINILYRTGDEIYSEDCPVLARRGVTR